MLNCVNFTLERASRTALRCELHLTTINVHVSYAICLIVIVILNSRVCRWIHTGPTSTADDEERARMKAEHRDRTKAEKELSEARRKEKEERSYATLFKG